MNNPAGVLFALLALLVVMLAVAAGALWTYLQLAQRCGLL